MYGRERRIADNELSKFCFADTRPRRTCLHSYSDEIGCEERADYSSLMGQETGMRRMQDGLAGPNGGAEDVDGTFNGGRETGWDFDR